MSKYYKFINSIESKSYTDYFLNTLVPELNFVETVKKQLPKNYIEYAVHQSKPILALSKELMTKYKFPPISHFLIFYHTGDQSIHSDGSPGPRWCSFNLPIIGWEKTKMSFYSVKSNATPRVAESRYYTPDEVTYEDHFECTNNWVLVHSGHPHNVSSVDTSNPRITLVTRFFGNPTFEELTRLISDT
jgi:hypothetical protein